MDLTGIISNTLASGLGNNLVNSISRGVFMAGGFNKAAVIAAFSQTPFYVVQVFASSVLFIAAGAALDRSGLKKRI